MDQCLGRDRSSSHRNAVAGAVGKMLVYFTMSNFKHILVFNIVLALAVLYRPVASHSQEIEQYARQQDTQYARYTYYPVHSTNAVKVYVTTRGDRTSTDSDSIYEAISTDYRTLTNVQYADKYRGTYMQGIGEGTNVGCKNGVSHISIAVWYQHVAGRTIAVFLNMEGDGCDFARSFVPKYPVYYDAKMKSISEHESGSSQWYDIDCIGTFRQ